MTSHRGYSAHNTLVEQRAAQPRFEIAAPRDPLWLPWQTPWIAILAAWNLGWPVFLFFQVWSR